MAEELVTVIAGINVLWQSDSEVEMEELRTLFRYHREDAPRPGAPVHHVAYLPVYESRQMPADATLRWEGEYLGTSDAHLYTSPSTGEDILVYSNEIWIVHNRREGRSLCYLYSRRRAEGGIDRHAMKDAVIILLHMVMAMYHRYVVHAAAVELNGAAHLFLGESGHGKSTLSMGLVCQGAGYMGDDLVFLYVEDGVAMAGALLSDTKMIPPEGDSRHKAYVDVVAQYGARPVSDAPIRALYYIHKVCTGPSRMEPQSAVDGMGQLIRASNNIRIQYDADVWLDVCQRTADQAPYSLFFFGDRHLLTKKLFEENA